MTTVPAIIMITLFIGVTIVLNVIHRRRMKRLIMERQGESICQFARSLPYRQLDTHIMREVYEAVQEWIGRVAGRLVPIRETDRFTETFQMDPYDLDDMATAIALRCGRSLDNCEANPYHDGVHTVGDLVRFLCAQAREADGCASA